MYHNIYWIKENFNSEAVPINRGYKCGFQYKASSSLLKIWLINFGYKLEILPKMKTDSRRAYNVEVFFFGFLSDRSHLYLVDVWERTWSSLGKSPEGRILLLSLAFQRSAVKAETCFPLLAAEKKIFVYGDTWRSRKHWAVGTLCYDRLSRPQVLRPTRYVLRATSSVRSRRHGYNTNLINETSVVFQRDGLRLCLLNNTITFQYTSAWIKMQVINSKFL